MSVADRLNKLSTDITNAYTSIENKGGTTPANKNTNNLSTAIDSIEVIEPQTAEGESLSLTNTKAMPYSDYVVEGKSEQDGEPSPSIPSEIHSVANNVNMFDIGVKSDYRGYNDQNVTTQGNYSWFTIENNKLKYLVQDYGTTLIYNKNQYKGNQSYNLQYVASSIYSRMLIKLRNGSDNGWLTDSDVTISGWTYIGAYNGWFIEFSEATNIEKIVNIPNCLYCVFGFGYGSHSGIIGTNQTISFIKIAKGSTPTSYTPYNQGTVTIKQRGTTENNDYTIQTEPLRSLPNGVKDTIEADGIHRRVGRYILPEIATLYSGTALGTQCQYATYSLSNSKTGGRNYNFISNILAPANDIYGQYKSYRNSTNIVVMTSTDDTLENFNSKISGAEVLYELATEIIEPLTQNQATTMLDIIKTGSYEGTTNINTDEDVKPTMKVDYYKKS